MSSQSTKPTVEKFAVDAEDDLDDLDDVLDEFTPGARPISPKPTPGPPPPTAATTTTFGRPRTNTRVDAPPKSVPGTGKLAATAEEGDVDEDALTNEFAQELAREMENLMREITSEGGKEKEETTLMTDEERAKALKAAWEAMLVEGMDANAGDLGKVGEEMGSGKEKAGGGAFQDKIKQTMDKLKDSESKMGGAGPGTAPTPESLEALLQSLGDLGLSGEGGDNETELAGFLETMMSQLMSKDVLYDPLKELAEGFPPYLANPPKPLSDEDKKRYENQLICVKKILVVFEKEGYSDTNEEASKEIVDLMSEMQSYGSPPSEIMGSLPPGFDAMGSEEGCTIG